jgi:hypothetical protein
MRKNGNYRSVIFQFSIVLLIHVMGLYTLNRVIPDSIQHLQMPAYLFGIWGTLKIRCLGHLAFTGNDLKEWVPAGFTLGWIETNDGFYITGDFSWST